MKPGSDIPWGSASSVTGRLPSASDASTARRVGSARAAKTPLSARSSGWVIAARAGDC